jgi:hypothetical protein
MDVKSFLVELLSALAKLDFVKDVGLKAEGLILSGRVMLQNSMFLEVYYNAVTETVAFALIEEQLAPPLKGAFLLLHMQREERLYVSSAQDLQMCMRGKDMKDKKKSFDELRPEYDFDYSKAVRGKYYKRLLDEGSNVVILDPDIAKTFHDSTSVNEALRSLLELTRSTKRLTSRSTGRAKKLRAG